MNTTCMEWGIVLSAIDQHGVHGMGVVARSAVCRHVRIAGTPTPAQYMYLHYTYLRFGCLGCDDSSSSGRGGGLVLLCVFVVVCVHLNEYDELS